MCVNIYRHQTKYNWRVSKWKPFREGMTKRSDMSLITDVPRLLFNAAVIPDYKRQFWTQCLFWAHAFTEKCWEVCPWIYALFREDSPTLQWDVLQVLTVPITELSRPSGISAASPWVAVLGGFCGTTCSHVRPQIKGITTRTYMHVACGAQKWKEGKPKPSVGSCLWEARQGDEFRHKSVLSQVTILISSIFQ